MQDTGHEKEKSNLIFDINNQSNENDYCLTHLLGTKNYYKIDHALFHAEKWRDEKGVYHKITNNTKAVYVYMLNNYNSFTRSGKVYHESQQRIADRLGLNLNTVNETAIKQLKSMGLIIVNKIAHKKYNTIVLPLSAIKGALLNDNIKEPFFKNEYKNTYDEYKTINKNYQQIAKVKADLLTEYVTITKSDFNALVKRREES